MRTPIFAMTVPPNSCRGVTLIELMISLTIGLLLTAVLGYAFLGSRQAFRTTDTLSRMQESARYAFERISSDIRMAGFTGCSFSTMANVLNNPNDWYKNLFGQPLIGYEEGVSIFPNDSDGNALPVLRGDAVTVLRVDNSREYIVDDHNPPSAQLQLTANHDIKQGEILVITDCQHAAVFQMTNVNNNTIATVNHNNGNAIDPGNCTKGLGNPVPNPCTANGTPYTFARGSRILRLSAVTYYIGTNDVGEPALFRQRLIASGLIASGGNAATTAEEMVEGVQDMQIQYGENTDGAPGVDTYVTADGVTNWTNVLSIRISLLMVSLSDESITTAPQAYTYNGATITPTDRLLRKAFTTTISVRNRL
ncbi:PilW family protein [Methylocaldum sp. 14B]|uniref:PilW family protein n=1 Tax=Methylocaldum sp. 14B TaxID=1912213 RepID=UPI00098B650F|nr:PilW family protein [Methylocaldum sp. 14B]